MRIGALTFLTFAMALAPLATALGQTPDRPWTEAQACLAEPDPAICWFRGMVGRGGAGLLITDPDLEDRPDILMLAGATTPVPAQPPAGESPENLETKPFFDAIDAAADAARAGSDAATVLAPLQALPVTGGYVMMNPLQEGTFSFGRLDAYQMITTALMRPRVQTPEPERLASAIMAAWEADLAEADEAAILGADSTDLAKLYAQRGDKAAARRVLAHLSPENEPALINALVDLDLFAEAAAVSDLADASHSLGRLRRRQAVLEQVAAAQMAGFAAVRDAAFEEMLAELTPEQRATLLAMQAEAEAEPDGAENAEDPAALEAAFIQEAEDELAWARDGLLVKADRAGQAALVRSTARQTFDKAMHAADAFGSGSRLARALTLLVQTSEAPEAIALTERAEAHARTRGDSHLQLLLPAIHAAWLKLDRPDRAEALIEEWRPLAAAQGRAFADGRDPQGVLSGDGQPGATQGLQTILLSRDDIAGARALGWLSPEAGLRRDFTAGRGLSRLDSHLAATAPDDQRRMLIHCWHMALEAGDRVSAAVCAERFADLADTPIGRSTAADALLQVAAAAAMKDDVATALRLAGRALATGSALEQGESRELGSAFSLTIHLRDVAKAMLRQSGRLPALPARVDTPSPGHDVGD